MIVGIDVGKNGVKTVYGSGRFYFKSKLYVYRPMRLENELGSNDFIIEYEGERYLGGDLGEREGEIPIQYTDTSKAHVTTLINLLTALHRIDDTFFKIVIGSPIDRRTDDEKQRIKEMLKGTHKIKVNGFEKVIRVLDVEISPEGAAGFWSDPSNGDVQGLDFGSTTINYFVMKDKNFIDKFSGTFPYGTENSITKDKAGIMKAIYSQLSNKFEKNRPTMIMGGAANEMFEYVQMYYPNAYVVRNPLFANAIGNEKIARVIYG